MQYLLLMLFFGLIFLFSFLLALIFTGFQHLAFLLIFCTNWDLELYFVTIRLLQRFMALSSCYEIFFRNAYLFPRRCRFSINMTTILSVFGEAPMRVR